MMGRQKKEQDLIMVAIELILRNGHTLYGLLTRTAHPDINIITLVVFTHLYINHHNIITIIYFEEKEIF